MSLGQNKAVAFNYIKTYEKGDIDAVMKFIGASYTLHPGGDGKPMTSNLRRQDESVFFSAFSDIKTVVEDQIAEGDKVANRIIMSCTHTGKYQGIPATGKRVYIPYIDILKIKDGKIVEEWIEFDMASIVRQIAIEKGRQ